MCATDRPRPRPLLVVADAGARLVRRGLVAPGDAVRWRGARVVVFRRGPVVCELPAACVDAPSRALYLPRDSQPARAHPVVHPGVRRCGPRMTLALYNTLTRRVEPFQPLAPPRVTLYTCGPTVWNYAHLGNFRTFLFEDLLRRYLEASGYEVFHIMNLTDVDDRTIQAARAAGTTLRQHTGPFGRGRPGWHLECSAMSLHEIGTRFGVETLDIHAGGVDLIFPHHEDEIAQSEVATGRPFARWWLHGEFLNVRGTKMSKRFGNFLAARDLREQGVDAAAVRLLFWQTHYRKPLDFTDEALAAAGEGVRRSGEFHARLAGAAGKGGRGEGRLAELAAEFEAAFRAALDDDLNAPQACAALFQLAHAGNRALDAGAGGAVAAVAALDRAMAVLDVLPTPRTPEPDFARWIEAQVAARERARKSKDFKEADRIRAALLARGVELEDTPTGTKWRVPPVLHRPPPGTVAAPPLRHQLGQHTKNSGRPGAE